MGALLYVQGCGMGMFAAPNAAAVMNSVPPENRGAASGMLATLQNTGQQVSLAIFFTIVILGLSAGLGGSAHSALASAGVGPPDLQILSAYISGNPTGALFGAFLGANPMQTLLGAAALTPGWVALPGSVTGTLEAPHFFANAIAPAFHSALGEAFLFAGVITAVGGWISASRGKRFIYDVPSERGSPPAAVPSSESPPSTGGAVETSTVPSRR